MQLHTHNNQRQSEKRYPQLPVDRPDQAQAQAFVETHSNQRKMSEKRYLQQALAESAHYTASPGDDHAYDTTIHDEYHVSDVLMHHELTADA